MKRVSLDNAYDMHLAMVNDKPYLFTEDRIDDSTVPSGYKAYEVADGDDCDGRFARIQNFILVNFIGTIIGRDELPMEQYGDHVPVYWCRYDEAYDKAYEEFEYEHADEEGDVWEEHLLDFEENHMPEDPDGEDYGVTFNSLKDYDEYYDSGEWEHLIDDTEIEDDNYRY